MSLRNNSTMIASQSEVTELRFVSTVDIIYFWMQEKYFSHSSVAQLFCMNLLYCIFLFD